MKLLLDTQRWLWMETTPERLSGRAAELVSGGAHELLLSAASSWEIAIKYAIGKLPLHQRDPFDRMLVAQVQCDGLTLLTADPLLRQYDLPIEWAG